MISAVSFAHPVMASDSKRDFDRLVELSKFPERLVSSDWSALPIYDFNGKIYVSVIGKMHDNPYWEPLINSGILRGSITGDIATMKVPLLVFADMNFDYVYSYL